MQTNPIELLESFEKELANRGKWYWTDKNGSRARILTAMQKMLKQGMSDADVKEIIIDLQFAGYVEHERQVKSNTGLSVRELMEKKAALTEVPEVAKNQNNYERVTPSVDPCQKV